MLTGSRGPGTPINKQQALRVVPMQAGTDRNSLSTTSRRSVYTRANQSARARSTAFDSLSSRRKKTIGSIPLVLLLVQVTMLVLVFATDWLPNQEMPYNVLPAAGSLGVSTINLIYVYNRGLPLPQLIGTIIFWVIGAILVVLALLMPKKEECIVDGKLARVELGTCKKTTCGNTS